MELVFDQVTKFYGPVIGVNDISCRIGPGITGLLGANGAGKSTLIKLAAGHLRPSLGKVSIGPYSAWSSESKNVLGYCPDLNHFYEEITAWEFVYTMARMHGYSVREARRRTESVLVEVGMMDRSQRKMAGCSHGMRQRIKLAQALLHDPQMLLLDEPLSGIDPGGRREINQLLRNLSQRGKTVLVSTHILGEIEQLATQVVVLGRGRLIAGGTLEEIRSHLDQYPLLVEIEVGTPRRLAALLAEREEVLGVEIRDLTLLVKTRQASRFFQAVGNLVLEYDLELRRMRVLDEGADAVFGYLQQGIA